MKRKQLKSKDLNRQLGHYNINLSKKDQVELLEDEKLKLILINKEPSFFYYQGREVPTLKYLQSHDLLKKITVDMGAVKFVVNGADVMRPGITEIEEIPKDDFIVVIDENNKKPLSVGVALFGAEEMKKPWEPLGLPGSRLPIVWNERDLWRILHDELAEPCSAGSLGLKVLHRLLVLGDPAPR